MADNITGAPLGATHYAGASFYKLDGNVWSYWNSLFDQWVRCADNRPSAPPHTIERIQPVTLETN